jgi:hypothetical protein
MRRFKVVGLCLLAVFAFSAMLAASAQAKKESSGPLDISSSGGAAHLGTELGVELKSTHNTGKGRFESGTGGQARALFYEVTTTSGGNCNNVAGQLNTVKTELLSEEVGFINKGTGEVGDSFKGAENEFSAQFECEGLGKIKVKGSVIGIVTDPPVNKPQKTGTLALKGVGGFKQEPEKFETMAKDTLESSFEKVNGGVYTPSAQFQEDTTENHGNGTVCKTKLKKGVEVEKCKPGFSEINTLASPGQALIGRCIKLKGGKFQEANCATLSEVAGKGKFEFQAAQPGENAKGYGPGEL